MKIDRDGTRVVKLPGAWETLSPEEKKTLLQKSRALQRKFAWEVIQPSVTEHAGQLVLFHHKFLTRVLSDTHSFAHGTEMIARDIYWG